jgi:predicted phosphohydrolase
VVCISDTHELHRDVVVPPGDLLIHAGDFSFFSGRRSQIADFNEWLGQLPHKAKIVIPGNHEFLFESEPATMKMISKAILLMNSAVQVCGVTVWGSPVTPLVGGAFGFLDPIERRKIYADIPPLTDIVVTHGPPAEILDRESPSDPPGGCRELRDAIFRVRPLLHVFGHIHSGYGKVKIGGTTFVNAALFGELGDLDKKPIVVEL